jgi:hypothetical protein
MKGKVLVSPGWYYWEVLEPYRWSVGLLDHWGCALERDWELFCFLARR